MFIVISIFLLGFLVELQGQNLTSDMSFIEKNERVDRMMESKDKPQDNLTSKKTKMFGKKSYIRAGGNTNGTVKKWKREISDFHSKKQEYDRAINQTIDDYYSQRKVAMDKYYTRQKEIFEKFKAKNQDDVTGVTTIKTTTTNDEIQTTKQPIDSSIAPENSVLGYHRVGERTHKENERLLYQHNLGIGLKGKSEIDAAFEVILDKQVSITCVELIPYNTNSIATMKILKGGVKYHFIKIKLQPEENHGLSYVIKVWGNDK